MFGWRFKMTALSYKKFIYEINEPNRQFEFEYTTDGPNCGKIIKNGFGENKKEMWLPLSLEELKELAEFILKI